MHEMVSDRSSRADFLTNLRRISLRVYFNSTSNEEKLSNCLRPSRHRARMCVPSALPLFRIGSRLHGHLFPSRLPALRGHTLSLVGRTLHTKSTTKCNEKQNGTPANFENAPKFSCICLAVFPTVIKNKTECPTILKKMIPK